MMLVLRKMLQTGKRTTRSSSWSIWQRTSSHGGNFSFISSILWDSSHYTEPETADGISLQKGHQIVNGVFYPVSINRYRMLTITFQNDFCTQLIWIYYKKFVSPRKK
ncbi:hypothetical protein HNY73_004792 [Argiope bruennichi]|uniref:Uncharacterized protein n=1 Tax=Argiope bruennichi TaxID=94029 RepID=A0A8T0FR47_ARGBR|nr:hypothetical protein HNY73_004792 [Argiope bruennichi]